MTDRTTLMPSLRLWTAMGAFVGLSACAGPGGSGSGIVLPPADGLVFPDNASQGDEGADGTLDGVSNPDGLADGVLETTFAEVDAGPDLPPPATCGDNVLNGDETDVDCGGACGGCPTGDNCDVNGDCLSGACGFGVCRDPGCDDGLKNQDETDVDCGGSKCGPCGAGGGCVGATDCAGGLLCEASSCCSPNACGDSCGAPPAETCDGLDNDCDGQIDEGVLNACGECGAVPAETCDGLDNDCDGQIDEDLNCGGPGCGELIISEYYEGASFDKALEITNLGGSNVSLDTVGLWILSNAMPGETEADGKVYSITTDGVLEPGDSLVLCHPSFDEAKDAVCDDFAALGALNYNGNDAVGITINGALVDKIGSFSGTGDDEAWEVAGVPLATKDHRLIRSPAAVTGELSWSVSMSTWLVSDDITDLSSLGEHQFSCAD